MGLEEFSSGALGTFQRSKKSAAQVQSQNFFQAAVRAVPSSFSLAGISLAAHCTAAARCQATASKLPPKTFKPLVYILGS